MGKPMGRISLGSWANWCRPIPEILPEFMDQPTSAQSGDIIQRKGLKSCPPERESDTTSPRRSDRKDIFWRLTGINSSRGIDRNTFFGNGGRNHFFWKK